MDVRRGRRNIIVAAGRLTGCRVLVVEDEMLIGLLIEDTLQELGCIVVGPVGKLDAALQLATSETLDVAILDVNIRGGHVYPVAEQLQARGIPFVLASGYGDWALDAAFRGQPRLNKPFTAKDLEEQVKAALQQAPRSGPLVSAA